MKKKTLSKFVVEGQGDVALVGKNSRTTNEPKKGSEFASLCVTGGEGGEKSRKFFLAWALETCDSYRKISDVHWWMLTKKRYRISLKHSVILFSSSADMKRKHFHSENFASHSLSPFVDVVYENWYFRSPFSAQVYYCFNSQRCSVYTLKFLEQFIMFHWSETRKKEKIDFSSRQKVHAVLIRFQLLHTIFPRQIIFFEFFLAAYENLLKSPALLLRVYWILKSLMIQ